MLKNGNVMDTNTITCLSKAILYFMALLEANQDTNIKKDVIKSKKIDIVSKKELNKELPV